MITVGQARNDDAILAAAARDRNDPAIVRAIDRGQRILLRWGNWADTVQEYLFNAVGGFIFVPPEIQAITDVQVHGAHGDVLSQTFVYLDNGPRCAAGATVGVIDRGPASTFVQPTWPTSIMLIADSCESTDPPLFVDIVARDCCCNDTATTESDGTILPYLRIPIVNGRTYPYPLDNILHIDRVTKPLTQGAVHLFEYSNETRNVGNLIISLAPYDQTPSWRKYEVTGCDPNACVRALAKRKHVTLYQDSQALMIDDLEAMANAISYYKALEGANLESAAAFRASALERLSLREKELRGAIKPVVEFDGHVTTTRFRRLGR